MSDNSFSDIINNLDRRFDQIEYEFYLLETFMESVGNELEYIIDEEGEFEEVVIPRLYYCPMLVILYSICEAAITEIAEIIQENQQYDVGINDMAGGFLKRAARYYDKVLHINLFTTNEDWNRLKDLQTIRHAIVHANGRIDYLEKDTRNKIMELTARSPEVEILVDYLTVTQEFLSESVSMMRNAIANLVTRVMERYPRSNAEGD